MLIFSPGSGEVAIVIVNFCFLERPQKRNCRNQPIHRRLTKTKSIGSGQDPESQAGSSQTAMVDCAWSWDGEEGMGKTMNQDRICLRGAFSVWSERAVERWQGERFEWARRMGPIFVAMLAGVCSREVGQLRLWCDWKIWVTMRQKGGVVLELFYSFRYFEPVEFFENRSDVVVFWGFSNSMGESILNSLDSVYLGDVYVQ